MQQVIGYAGGLALVILVVTATPAPAQEGAPTAPAAPQPRWMVEGAAGLQTDYSGDVQSVAFGFTPTRRLTLLLSAVRSYVRDEIEVYEDGFDAERGGTDRFISAEFRYAFLPGRRISPYVLAGGGRGVSRTNVNAFFPESARRDIAVFYYGGGARIPVGPRLDAFVDARFILALEAASDYLGVRLPVQAGLALRF